MSDLSFPENIFIVKSESVCYSSHFWTEEMVKQEEQKRKETRAAYCQAIKDNDVDLVKKTLKQGEYLKTEHFFPISPLSPEMVRVLVDYVSAEFKRGRYGQGYEDFPKTVASHLINTGIKGNYDNAANYIQILKDFNLHDDFKATNAETYSALREAGFDSQCFDLGYKLKEWHTSEDKLVFHRHNITERPASAEIKKDLKTVIFQGYRPDISMLNIEDKKDKELYRYMKGELNFMESTKEQSYIEGKIDGLYEKIDIDGNVTKKNYKDGKLNGFYQEYRSDGTITSMKHYSNGVEDTEIYLAKQRIEAKRKENMAKLEGKPKIIQTVAEKIADSKAFNNIALKVAIRKVKKSQGE